MCSTSLKIKSQKINGYKGEAQSELPAFTLLQMADQHSFISFFIPLIFFLCFVQSKERDFQKWNSTRWMEVGRNRSGLEWCLVGSMSPKLYAWQPSHGDRGPTYTKEPKPGPKFGSSISRRSPELGDPDSFPPGFNQTVARKVARKLESAFQTTFTTELPIASNMANLVETAEPHPTPRLASLAPTESPRSSMQSYMRSLNRSLTQSAFRIPPKVNGNESKKASLFPIIPHRIPKPFYPSQDTGPPILTEVNITDLASESTRQYAEQNTLHEHWQTTPDAITELGLNQDQYRNLKAMVKRRFLVGYDCSKPVDIKPISSFINDHCEPTGANSQEDYEIQPVTQFQIVQYETRREFLGTRCESYISQFTYYCGNADHTSPLPQETFFRRSKVLA